MPHVGTPATFTNVSNISTANIPLTLGVNAGYTLILAVSATCLTGQDGSFTATDTKGNTWSEVAHIAKAGTVQLSVLTSQLTTALTPSDVITLDHAGVNAGLWAVDVDAFDDLSGMDVSATSTGTTGAFSLGPTTAASQNNNLVYAAFGFANAGESFTPQAGYDSSPIVHADGTTTRNTVAEWAYVSTAGTRSTTGNATPTTSWAGALVAFKSAAPAQVLRPKTDVTTTNWTKTPSTAASFAACINEVTPDDTNFIESAANPVGQVYEVLVDPGSMPTDQTATKITVRLQSVSATSGTAKLELYEGTTLRNTATTVNLTPTWTNYDVPLTSTQASAISDYTNLRIRVTVSAS